VLTELVDLGSWKREKQPVDMGIKYSSEAQIQVKKAKVHSGRDVKP